MQGEVEYPVPPLAEPEAVTLFCERAQLEPSEEIAEICARLDNLPLAVELAAARAKALSPAQILERLSQRLDLLKGGRDADPRQQTLRATIEWSYDLLTPEEQALFARLSVFAGGCTLQAAEEVCDADLDTLQSLVEKSLVRFTNERYWMLETIREYAADRLAKEDRRRSPSGTCTTFSSSRRLQNPSFGHSTPMHGCRGSTRSKQTSERRSVASFDGGSAVRRSTCRCALPILGDPCAARRSACVARSGARARRCGPRSCVRRHWSQPVASWQSDWPTSIPVLEEAIALSRKLDDTAGIGRCLGFIGHARLYTGDSEGAAAALDEGVELARSAAIAWPRESALQRGVGSHRAARLRSRPRDVRGIDSDRPSQGYEAEWRSASCASGIPRHSQATSSGRSATWTKASSCSMSSADTWTPVAHRYLGLLALLRGKIDEAESILRASLREGREEAPQFDLPHWIEELAAVAAAKGEACGPRRSGERPMLCSSGSGWRPSKRIVRCVRCSEGVRPLGQTRGTLGHVDAP